MANSELFAGRYRVLRILGSGGMGVVSLVEDTARDNKIMALKAMRGEADLADAESFRAEFRHIRGVQHPHIPEVYDFGVLPPPGRELYFTCEFVDGSPLDKLATTWSPGQLHEILVALCRALAFLHSRGLVHRDIKPQNVLASLDSAGRLQMLKLVDFGLAARRGQAIETVGTVDYLAPELVLGQPATVASDIYAVGMLLFVLATGRMPFAGSDPLAVARKRCTTAPPSPLRFRHDLPVGLADVISALIRIKPEDRPPSARHVIALLNESEGTDYPYETAETRSAYIHSAGVVSHEEVRDALLAEWSRHVAGDPPPPALIVGCRGVGRKRLIRELAAEISLAGTSVRLLASASDLAANAPCTVMMIPDLESLPREPTLRALAQARTQGAWIVAGSAHARADLLAALGSWRVLNLKPLDLEGVRQFVAATFPEHAFPAEFTDRLYARTMGFPGALRRALNHLLEQDTLRIGLSGWELLPGTEEIPLDADVAAYVHQIAAMLPLPQQDLIRILASSEAPLSEVLLSHAMPEHVSGADLAEFLRAIDELGWLEKCEDGYRLRFSAVAESIRGAMSEAERCNVHDRLRRAWSHPDLAQHSRARQEMLFHDVHGGTWQTAADEAARVLKAALDAGNTGWVRRLCESGLRKVPPPELRAVLCDALSAVEYHEGNLERAAAWLSEVVPGEEAEANAANLGQLARLAWLEEKLGRADKAEQILARCLSVLPDGFDSRAALVFGTLAWIAFKRGEAEEAQRLGEEGLLRVPPQSPDPAYAHLLNTIGSLAFYRGDNDAAGLMWKRCLEVGELLRDQKLIAHMHNNLGVLAAQTGDRLRARALWQKCAEISREINDVHRLAAIYNNLGIDALESGELGTAEEYYLKALVLFRRLKNPREQVAILSNLGELNYFRGNYPRAQAYLHEAVELAFSLQDREAAIEPLIYLGQVLTTLQELDDAAAVLEQARAGAHAVGARTSEGQALEALAHVCALQRAWGKADDLLQRARALLTPETDPLVVLNFHLTECALAAEREDGRTVARALAEAQKVADIKWDPRAAARMLVYGLLFAEKEVDANDRQRVLRQLSVYPELLWRFHWACARRLGSKGAFSGALEEFGRGATVLKSIAARLSEERRKRYLTNPQILRFKEEAVTVRAMIKGN